MWTFMVECPFVQQYMLAALWSHGLCGQRHSDQRTAVQPHTGQCAASRGWEWSCMHDVQWCVVPQEAAPQSVALQAAALQAAALHAAALQAATIQAVTLQAATPLTAALHAPLECYMLPHHRLQHYKLHNAGCNTTSCSTADWSNNINCNILYHFDSTRIFHNILFVFII